MLTGEAMKNADELRKCETKLILQVEPGRFSTVPVLLIKVTGSGDLIVTEPDSDLYKFITARSVYTLSREMMKVGWVLYDSVFNNIKEELGNLKGQQIRWKKPIEEAEFWYLMEPVTLLSSSKYHLVVKVGLETKVLDMRWKNPKNWEKV